MKLQNIKKTAQGEGALAAMQNVRLELVTAGPWYVVFRKYPHIILYPNFFIVSIPRITILKAYSYTTFQNYVKTKKSKQEVFHKSRLNYPRINISYLIISSSLRVHTYMSSSKVHSYNTTPKFLKYQKGEIGSFFERRSNMS